MKARVGIISCAKYRVSVIVNLTGGKSTGFCFLHSVLEPRASRETEEGEHTHREQGTRAFEEILSKIAMATKKIPGEFCCVCLSQLCSVVVSYVSRGSGRRERRRLWVTCPCQEQKCSRLR